ERAERVSPARILGLDLLRRQCQLDPERDEPLLGTVVDIALDLSAAAALSVDPEGPSFGQLLERGAQVAAEAVVLERGQRIRACRLDQRRILREVAVVDDGKPPVPAFDSGDR